MSEEKVVIRLKKDRGRLIAASQDDAILLRTHGFKTVWRDLSSAAWAVKWAGFIVEVV